VSIETSVPPVRTLPARSSGTASLEAGRRIYLEDCTHCHTAQPVRDFAAARWPGIIADMAERTKLSASQEQAVLAYVLAASQAPGRAP
jgi:mono/diheme cytochrome c family protein